MIMSDRSVVWVTGSSGFLGSVVCERMERAGFTVLGTNSEVSVCDPERLEAFAEEVQPGVVINCAGIRRDATSLSDRIKAYEVNALGARNVALAANTIGATIVQVSSDDVYSSKLEEPVNEFDEPQPDTPYGKTKRAGELMVRNTTPDHIIVRPRCGSAAPRTHEGHPRRGGQRREVRRAWTSSPRPRALPSTWIFW